MSILQVIRVYQLLVLIPESNELEETPLEKEEELTELEEEELPKLDPPKELLELLPKPPNELPDEELLDDPNDVIRTEESRRLLRRRRASRSLFLRSRSLRTRFARAFAAASSPLAEASD